MLIQFIHKYNAFILGLVAIFIFFFLDFTPYSVPNAPAMLTTVLVFVAFQNGLKIGLFFSGVIWGYTLIHFSLPGHLLHYSKPNLIRIISFGIMFPLDAWMVGLLKNKLTNKIDEETSLKMQLLSSAKLSALGEMAGSVAHEINNPITIISSVNRVIRKMIEKGITDPNVLNKHFDNIDKTVVRISKIIEGLKIVSRDASRDKLEDHKLFEIFEDVLPLCESKLSKNKVTLMINLDDKIFQTSLHCNRVQLSQVFLNMISNSCDAIKDLDDRTIKDYM